MHKESYDIMSRFVYRYMDMETEYNILDVGSQNINGTYKYLFMNDGWTYTGIDIEEGDNVDVVSRGLYDFGLDKQYEVVVSGNCMEHVESPWLWIKEVEKSVKKDGLVCIIVPFSIHEHKYPVDCWRILPDGFSYLMEKHCNFEILECKLNTRVPRGAIQDTYCIAKKL